MRILSPKLGKIFVAVSVSFSMLLSAGLFVAPDAAHAYHVYGKTKETEKNNTAIIALKRTDDEDEETDNETISEPVNTPAKTPASVPANDKPANVPAKTPASVPAKTPVSAQANGTAAATKADAIIATGKKFLGVPYKFGAKSGRTDAFDCSSFVQYVYKQNGINLPRSSRQQSQVGTPVSRNQLKPGDLVFFYSPIHHVAIYIGNGKILHTYGKPGVTISDMNSGWWSKHFTTARRVL